MVTVARQLPVYYYIFPLPFPTMILLQMKNLPQYDSPLAVPPDSQICGEVQRLLRHLEGLPVRPGDPGDPQVVRVRRVELLLPLHHGEGEVVANQSAQDRPLQAGAALPDLLASE